MASGVDIGRLNDAVRDAYSSLHDFRLNRAYFLKMYAGSHYGANREIPDSPVNLIELAVSTYSFRLAANNPRAHVSTPYKKLRPYAEVLRLALDYLIPKLGLGVTIKRAVKDALFGMGIVKVGINDTRELIRGFSIEGGQPFAEVVSPQDFVFDTSAKRLEDCQFIGNRFLVDAAAARKSGYFDRVSELHPASSYTLDYEDANETEMSTDRRSRELSQYRDRYLLWEVWLPFENKLVTLDEDLSFVVKEQEWTGPRKGPYSFLSFSDVPDNILPLPPAALWVDLHDFANETWRKLFSQARRQKNVLPFAGGTAADATRIKNAQDGDVVQVNNAAAFQGELKFGGPDQQLLGLVSLLEPVFSRMAGNLDVTGGLSAMTDTASQEAQLNQNANRRFDSMSQQVSLFAKDIMSSLAWWMWSDPYIELPLAKRIGNSVELPVSFSQRTKAGDFLDYNFEIVPHSAEAKQPSQKIQEILNVVQQLYLPMSQALQEQGIQLDMVEMFKLMAEYLGLPELNGVLSIGEPQPSPRGENTREGGISQKPPTHSVYERISRSGGSYQQQMTNFAREQMGANLQPSEKAGFGGGAAK